MPDDNIAADPLLGSALGGVELRAKLGTGGMGAVYRGRHTRLGIEVAIKVLTPPSKGSDMDCAVQRFFREARTAASIRHPNLVRVYDTNVENGVYYIVMDLVEGESAAARLKRGGPLGEKEAARVALAAAEALAEAHARGVVHRDVKPDNILLDPRGGVFVADLGLAKAFAGEGEFAAAELSLSTQVLGTPRYMAPEQTRSARDVGPQADVWSLGVTLLQLATGLLPWRDADLADLIHKIRREPPPDALTGALTPGLREIVERALRKAPEERYRDCGEMAAALRAWLALPKAVAEPLDRTMSLMDVGDLRTRTESVRPQVAVMAASVAIAFAAGKLGAGPLGLFIGMAGGVASAIAGPSAWLVAATVAVSALMSLLTLPYLSPGEAVAGLASGFALMGPGLLTLWRKRRGKGERTRLVAAAGIVLSVLLLAQIAAVVALAIASSAMGVREADPADDHHELAREMEHEGRYAEAIREYSRAIELRPDSIDSLGSRADLHERRGEYDLALTDRLRLVEMNPKDAYARYCLGYVRKSAGDAAGAIADFTEAIRLRRDYTASYIARAEAFMAQGEPARAAADYSRVIEYDPELASYYLVERALANSDAGDTHAADADFREVAGMSQDAALSLAWRAADRLEPGRALSALDAVLESWPLMTEALIKRASARLKLGDIDGAAGDCSRVLEIEPGHRGALTQRAEVHNKAGRHEEAVADLKKAIELTPDPSLRQYFQTLLGQSLFMLARTSYDSEDYARAADIYSEILQLAPRDAFALSSRAMARVELGDFTGALADADAAVALDPEDSYGYSVRADVKEALGDKDGAEVDRAKAYTIGEWN